MNKTFFEVIETFEMCVKQFQIKTEIDQHNFKLKFTNKTIFRERFFVNKFEKLHSRCTF